MKSLFKDNNAQEPFGILLIVCSIVLIIGGLVIVFVFKQWLGWICVFSGIPLLIIGGYLIVRS